ncbi:MAG: response regulator transcription factor [Dermatophilus congolensis]|nr:response regulator transcription factor [Dermatophilus congolensis]
MHAPETGEGLATVLLAEDDDDLRLTTRLVLERQGFDVHVAADGLQAWAALQTMPVDVAVLDVVMPGMDGIRLVKRIRENVDLSGMPVILLTARDLPHDQIAGLEAGADDYVTKPFDGEVLAARIRAVARRHAVAPSAGGGQAAHVDVVGDLQVDRAGMVVSRAGDVIEVSATEFKLLSAFLDHLGQVLSRVQLLDRVWGDAEWTDPRVVDVTVQRLRSKIGADMITTVRGAGYKMVPR